MSLVKHLTGVSAEDLTADEIAEVARQVAERARGAQQPLKSVASQKREALRLGADPALVETVVGLAREALTLPPVLPPPDQSSGAWLTPIQAAKSLGVSMDWVLQRLKTPEGRRLLGYPWYDGRRWHISSLACEPETRTAFLTELPEYEPPENVSLLPETEG